MQARHRDVRFLEGNGRRTRRRTGDRKRGTAGKMEVPLAAEYILQGIVSMEF